MIMIIIMKIMVEERQETPHLKLDRLMWERKELLLEQVGLAEHLKRYPRDGLARQRLGNVRSAVADKNSEIRR